jgi:hypothetical protein
MLLKTQRHRTRLLAVVACLMPTVLMAAEPPLLLSRFQEPQQVQPAPATGPAKSTEGTPVPPATPRPNAETTPAPPKQADGVAHVRSAACRAGYGPNSNAGCGPKHTAGCIQNGLNWGPGGCTTVGCNYGNCSLQDGMIGAGRPYTFGDLGMDMCAAKCKVRDTLGFNNCNGGGTVHSWWYDQQFKSQCRRAYRNQALSAWFSNKFNYFRPSGCCGEGCPPIGAYSRVYAADPNYYDARDEQIYASPVTGLPTAIPLAPNVRYQYNYSWGYPGSRLTPISTYSNRQ